MHAASLTALVGREEESELLLRRWSRAKTGEGQVVLISGEGGYWEIAAHGRASGTPRHGTAHDEHRLTLKFQIFLARIRVVQGFVSAVKVLVSPSSVDSKTEFDR
jgi:hypothetical protein